MIMNTGVSEQSEREGGQAGKLQPAAEGKLRDSIINLLVEGAT